jgi:uncharacterized protein
MRDRLVDFIDKLRQAGVNPSPSETIDAVAAVAAAGVEREGLRESLAATLVKDHTERPVFDEVFDRFFVLPGRKRGKGERPRSHHEGTGVGPGGEGVGEGRIKPEDGKRGHAERQRAQERPQARPTAIEEQSLASRQLAEHRRLIQLPFREMQPDDVDAARQLVEELGRRFRARWSRRLRQARRGRLDMRRTIRRSMSRGGVPVELLLRRPRPGKSDLLALVDLSYSTATAAQFLLALLVPAHACFRRVTLLAYVDTPVEISVEDGHVVPHEPLDLNARSDFGKVLHKLGDQYEPLLGRNTVLLILGDARNNRRPPRADLLARCHHRVRAVFWLNPEPPERWNTGDSVMAAYVRHADCVLAAHNLATLAAAMARLMRPRFQPATYLEPSAVPRC